MQKQKPLLTKAQIKILTKNRSPGGWEYEDNCAVCQFMKRMDFANNQADFFTLKEAFIQGVKLGILTGDEIDLKLLETDLESLSS